MWKSQQKVQMAVKTCIMTSNEFKAYDVRVMYETADYEKARQKLKQAEVLSDLQTDNEDIGQVKRKKIPNRRYESISDTDSDTESPCVEKRASPRKKQKSLADLPLLPMLPHDSFQQNDTTTPSEADPQPSALFRNLSSPKQTASAMERKIVQMLEELKESVRRNGRDIKRLTDIIEKQYEQPLVVDDNSLEEVNLPLKSQQAVKQLEEQLKNDQMLHKSLLQKLCAIGGSTLEMNCRRIMGSLLTDQLAAQYNWVGKGEKNAFRSLKLQVLVTKAVQSCHKSTENEVEKVVKDWLRYAGDRSGGRKRREERRKQKITENVEPSATAD